MEKTSLLKLQYLLEGLTGKQIPMEILEAIENDAVNIKTFHRACNKQMGIPFPVDPRTEKYKDIPHHSVADLEKLFKQRFPGQLTVTLKGINAELLSFYVQKNFVDEELDALIEDNPITMQVDLLDVKLTIDSDTAWANMWPDASYEDTEMDEWFDDIFGENESLHESLCKDSRSTNFIYRHPDLKDGKYTFYLCEGALLEQTVIEGIPFPQVADIIRQNPDMTTSQLKAALADIRSNH